MNAVSLADQRTAIYDALVALDIGNVDKYARRDPVPPGVMIPDPRIDFPDNSMVGLVEWSIWLLGQRTAPVPSGEALDATLSTILLAVAKGCGVGLVLRRVEPIVRTIEGYPLPGYTIMMAATLPNC